MPEADRLRTHAEASGAMVAVPAFIDGLAFASLPDDVIAQARRCLLDLIGTAAAGSTTRLAAITNAYAANVMGGAPGARILFDGRRASMPGAAFAGGTMIDSVDAHDGHVLTKGHAGVAVLPALLVLIDAAPTGARDADGREFLAALVLGYEIGTRAGIALHRTVPDYHCSGAWNALACAAVAARWLRFDHARTREALGIAEYFGPRGQMLRVTDTPTMLKDGSGWGANVGVTAALLAREGFTGAPAITIERDDLHDLWSDLGARWRIREQYFKAYPVCRWAQPAVEAALELRRAHGFMSRDIAQVSIASFREAVDLGAGCTRPRNTEEAQYSLPLPVAAALAVGRVGVAEIDQPGLDDPEIGRLLSVMALTEDAEFSRRFPAERWARVEVTLRDGRRLASAPARARGNPENPLSDDELRDKYRALTEPVLGAARTDAIARCVASLGDDRAALPALVDAVLGATKAVEPARR
jgi:2-methylcitrate dehydratase PrpD